MRVTGESQMPAPCPLVCMCVGAGLSSRLRNKHLVIRERRGPGQREFEEIPAAQA